MEGYFHQDLIHFHIRCYALKFDRLSGLDKFLIHLINWLLSGITSVTITA